MVYVYIAGLCCRRGMYTLAKPMPHCWCNAAHTHPALSLCCREGEGMYFFVVALCVLLPATGDHKGRPCKGCGVILALSALVMEQDVHTKTVPLPRDSWGGRGGWGGARAAGVRHTNLAIPLPPPCAAWRRTLTHPSPSVQPLRGRRRRGKSFCAAAGFHN